LIKKLHKAYIDVTGDSESPLITIGGGTYARSMKNAVAFGAQLPGREEVAHNVDEYMSIDDLMLSIEIYAQAIKSLGE
jgi:succinyl-diaminopimelate desuccinylase